MKTVTITRRSKLGWEYTSGVHQTEKGLVVDDVDKPYFVGTYAKVNQSIKNSRDFQSLLSGGTYYNCTWFVKLAGKWHKVTPYFHNRVHDLDEFAEVEVEVEG